MKFDYKINLNNSMPFSQVDAWAKRFDVPVLASLDGDYVEFQCEELAMLFMLEFGGSFDHA